LSIKPLYLFSEMASGGRKGRIPWTQLLKAQGDYILDEYLPAGITMMQNHHLRLSDANTLLQHWTTRQAVGQIAFRFKNVIKTSWQSKPALTAGGVSADIGPSNREEVPDGIKKAQAQGGDGDFQGDGEGSEDNDAQAGHDAAEDPGPSMVSEFLT
jgi:hypothetical protein